MKSIWIRADKSRLRSYGATTRGKVSVVKIEVEVSDPHALAYLLEDLGEFNREQQASLKRAPSKQARQLMVPPPSRDGE